MPTRAQWKFAEDKLARFFGVKRRPLSGSNSRSGGTDDADHPTLYLESKYSKYIPVMTLYRETKEKATQENKTPVIGLREKSKKGFLLCIHSDDLETVAVEYLTHLGYSFHESNQNSSVPKI